MIFVYLFALLATAFAGWRTWRRLRYFLHVYQLEGYKPHQYRSWLSERWPTVGFRLSHKIAIGVLGLAYVGFYHLSPFWTAILALPAWAITFASSRLYRSDKEKKPLAYTSRLQRQLGVAATITALFPVAGLLIGITELSGLLWFLAGFFVADFGAPFWVLLAGWITRPIEKRIHEGFKRQARAKLAERPDLKIIGVTGSYGKTSTKFIIEEILQQKYSVLATPSSYNTPMGFCLVINQKLRPEHQVLVLEYGMRYSGDIRELCNIARPSIAAVTNVGVAHLETMGSVDAIEHEKGELVACLDEDGIAVLNAGDERVNRMSDRAPGTLWRVAVRADAPDTDADLVAENIQYDTEGTTFTVVEGDRRQQFQTQLLGRHNVLNLLLGAAVGRAMGLRLRQIAHAVRRVEPVEHRLQLRRDGRLTVIDDAFNSNPVGARNAVEILGQMDGGRRVIVTPGMIELGERQHEENRTLGMHIANHDIDLAVLIGQDQTAPIREGLEKQQFPQDRIKTFESLFDAQDFLQTYLDAGDIVLYENDLPDQYDV